VELVIPITLYGWKVCHPLSNRDPVEARLGAAVPPGSLTPDSRYTMSWAGITLRRDTSRSYNGLGARLFALRQRGGCDLVSQRDYGSENQIEDASSTSRVFERASVTRRASVSYPLLGAGTAYITCLLD
jgi:hypothetical protein